MKEKRLQGLIELRTAAASVPPDPVSPVLVLLHFLEGHAERMGRLLMPNVWRRTHFLLPTIRFGDLLFMRPQRGERASTQAYANLR